MAMTSSCSAVVGAGWDDAAVRSSVNVRNFGEFAAPEVFAGGACGGGAAGVRVLVNCRNFGEFAAREVFAEVACRAEEAGWDALLVWDHVVEQKDLRREIADPWILLPARTLAAPTGRA